MFCAQLGLNKYNWCDHKIYTQTKRQSEEESKCRMQFDCTEKSISDKNTIKRKQTTAISLRTRRKKNNNNYLTF